MQVKAWVCVGVLGDGDLYFHWTKLESGPIGTIESFLLNVRFNISPFLYFSLNLSPEKKDSE